MIGAPTVWVHCGTYKTGSSSIQNGAYGAREDLSRYGWLYPLSGLVVSEPDVGFRHAQFVYKFNKKEAWEKEVRSLLDELDVGPGYTNVLLSSEAWSRPRLLESLESLVRRLRSAGI